MTKNDVDMNTKKIDSIFLCQFHYQIINFSIEFQYGKLNKKINNFKLVKINNMYV